MPGSAVARAIAAASIGNFVEWFGFVSYSYVATTIGKEFFPRSSPTAALISTFGVLAVASFVRPLGAVVFGPWGDRVGRRKVLSVTILLMSASTMAIGLLPTYAHIGIAAPILLVVLRMLQGFSQGGEFTGAATFIAEYSDDRRRGLMCSLTSIGVRLGFLAAAGLITILTIALSPEGFDAWGWRVPFILAMPLGFVGLYLRNKLAETPAFEAARQSGSTSNQPLRETFTHGWRPMMLLILTLVILQVGSYTVLTYLPTYLTVTLAVNKTTALLVADILIVTALILIPITGWLSDLVGRKRMLIAGCLGFALLSYPAFILITKATLAYVLTGSLMLSICLDLLLGVFPALIVEIFPTHLRSSGTAISYNLCVAIFGGLTPVVMTALVSSTGNAYVPAYYLIGAALISLPPTLSLVETAGKSLHGSAQRMR